MSGHPTVAQQLRMVAGRDHAAVTIRRGILERESDPGAEGSRRERRFRLSKRTARSLIVELAEAITRVESEHYRATDDEIDRHLAVSICLADIADIAFCLIEALRREQSRKRRSAAGSTP